MISRAIEEKKRKEKRIDLCRRRDVWSERFAFEFEQKAAKLSNGGAALHVQRSLNLEETIICNRSHLRTQKARVAWDSITVGFGKCCFIPFFLKKKSHEQIIFEKPFAWQTSWKKKNKN